MPAFIHRDSYPHYTNKTPSSLYHSSGSEVINPHVNLDPSMSCSGYGQPWPFAGNWGYQIPWNSCCSHSNFPNPPQMHCGTPYLYFPSPAPAYCCGTYPPFPQFHPVPYAPLHFSHELPRYVDDKHAPADHHCCGCPNHPCRERDGRTLKVQEQVPDVERRGEDSVVPVQGRNYPYPVVWLPPEYTSSTKQPKPFEQHERDESSLKRNGWFPFNISYAPKSNDSGEEGGFLDQRSKAKDFPYPIFWMPYRDAQGEAGSKDNQETSPVVTKHNPYTLRFVPMELSDGHGQSKPLQSEVKAEDGGDSIVTEEPDSQKPIPVNHAAPPPDRIGDSETQGNNDERGVPSKMGKPGCQKLIPVKHVESSQSREEPGGSRGEEKVDLHVKKLKGTADSTSSGINSKRQSPSPPKTSKLPPICLRVDPLPKKKNGNGSARSRSPPASKDRSKDTETSKGSSLSHLKDEVHEDSRVKESSCSNEVEAKEKIITVLDKRAGDSIGGVKTDQSKTGNPSNFSNDSTKIYEDGHKQAALGNKEVKTETTTEENVKASANQESIKETGDVDEKKKKILSETEAAVAIQSAFRGHVVRKWETLKKLRQIAEICDGMTILKDCIQKWESNAELRKDRKQRTVLGETIMRFLLDLDTIQCLHPSLREMRKSLARELVALQEKLDRFASGEADDRVQEQTCIRPSYSGDEGDTQKKKAEETSFNRRSQGSMVRSESGSEQGNENEPAVDKIANNDESNDVRSLATSNDENVGNVTPVEGDAKAQEMTAQEIEQHELDDTGAGNLGKELENKEPGEDKQIAELANTNPGEDKLIEVENDACQLSEISVRFSEGHIPINDMDMDAVMDNMNTDLPAQLPVSVLDTESAESEPENVALMAEWPESSKHDEAVKSEFENVEVMICPKENGALNFTSNETVEKEVPMSEESDVWMNDDFSEQIPKDSSCNVGADGSELPKDLSISVGVNESESHVTDITLVAQDFAEAVSEGIQTNAVEEGEAISEVAKVAGKEESEEQVLRQEPHCMEESIADHRAAASDGVLSKLAPENTVGSKATGVEAEKQAESGLAIIKPGGAVKLPVVEINTEFDTEKKLMEENEKLRDLMTQLIEAGKIQLAEISNLTGKVKELEKKLSKRRRLKPKHCKSRASRCTYSKPSNSTLRA